MKAVHDIVVIGGGLLGCALAWMLARDRADIVLLEKDQINQHASGQNAGSLHFQLEYRMMEQGLDQARVAAEAMPLHLDSAKRWARLGDELGESLGVVQTGGLMLAENDEQADLLYAKSELERSWGLDVRVISGQELRTTAPYLSDTVVAASFCPIEGKADTRTAAPALARGAARLGADIRTRSEVVAIDRDGSHWSLTVRDGHGAPDATIHAATVMIAAGVWTTEVGTLLDVDLPTVPLALTMTATMKTAKFIPHLIQHAGTKLSLKQSLDGNLLIGGGWPARLMIDDAGNPDFARKPELLRHSVAGNARAAARVVPRTGNIPALRTWVGTTTVTPDQLPLVGPLAGKPGVFVATGGSAFTLGPAFAHVLVQLAQGRAPDMDLSAYDPARYARLQ
ncbi:FAD-dependent oxidoreductase [Microbacterium kribbense]|uniref:FAD-dependent oxidoreductase n=1 Tax=Microbacterium kribbense TaxID=433645 RepID=A0ABP7GVB8_9MICO